MAAFNFLCSACRLLSSAMTCTLAFLICSSVFCRNSALAAAAAAESPSFPACLMVATMSLRPA